MIEIAIVAGAGAVAIIAVLVLAIQLRGAADRAADARVADATKAGQIAIDTATIATLRDSIATEKRRSDALDDALAQVAADGDIAGARARVLQRWAKAGADPTGTPGGDPHPVPTDPAPVAPAVDREGLYPLNG